MLKEFIDDLRRHGIAVFDLIQQNGHAFLGHFLHILGHAGQVGNEIIPQFQPVEAHNGYILRHPQAVVP